MKRAAAVLGAAAAAAALSLTAARAQEFKFDASEYARKTFEFTGYLEYKRDAFRLNPDGASYKLNFYRDPERTRLERDTLTFKPSAKLRLGESGTANLRAHLEASRDDLGGNRSNRFDEAYLSWKPAPGLTLDAGKVAVKWGKGYAWNPVAFVERPKDPNDPELGREGFTLLSADWIRNFEGPLATIAFTPVVVPVSSDTNPDFGAAGHWNVGGKLYLLYRDTDIDFMFLADGSRTRRFGMDFSRNLGSNLELHGEWARVKSVRSPVLDALGAVTLRESDATSWLAGMRYITERETTWIVEYYRNGAGYRPEEMRNFYRLADAGAAAFASGGGTALLKRAASAAQGGFGRPNAGRNYLYVRASQKEPFDILYFTPALTLIGNLDERSFSIAPELFYNGFTNVELRLRALFLAGGAGTEFGEKQNSRRIELLARFYF